MSNTDQPVVFVWPGDLHLESPERENMSVARWMAGEVNALAPDFVQFAGDNVQHAREDRSGRSLRRFTGAPKPPFHALVGDHDAHHDAAAMPFAPTCRRDLRRVLAPRIPVHQAQHAWSRIRSASPRSRSSGSATRWTRRSRGASASSCSSITTRSRSYETFDGPGIAEWREIVQTRPVTAIFCGHTHYGQIANDGQKRLRRHALHRRAGGWSRGIRRRLPARRRPRDDLSRHATRRGRSCSSRIRDSSSSARIRGTSSAGPKKLRVRVWSQGPVASVQACFE